MNHKRITYTKEQVLQAVKESYSIATVLSKLGLAPRGGNYKTIKQVFKDWKIDTSHFTGQGWNTNLKFVPKKAQPLEQILVKNSTFSTYNLKNRLLKEGIKSYKCECCGLQMWQGKLIPLELHHIDGDNTNNQLNNLQLLCPNCHALTDNYRGKNRK